MTYKHSLFTFKDTCDLCCCLILDWTNMWLDNAKFKLEYTNISLGVNYTGKKNLYIIFFFFKISSRGSA